MTSCIESTAKRDKDGYARVYFGGKMHGAHRLAWANERGDIPPGMTVDHLCFNRACVNVAHMQLLSHVDNCRRQRSASKTHCVNGHPFDDVNGRTRARGSGRDCRACQREATRRYVARKAA